MKTTSSSRVLVVDDNQDIRNLLATWLKAQGLEVVTAANGRSALAKLAKTTFDLMILDIMMPGLNGFDVLTQLKNSPPSPHMPIIVVSAMDDVDNIVRCIELGAEDCLFKPLHYGWLKARLDSCLEKKRLRDQEQAFIRQLQVERSKLAAEQERSERLLLNILPVAIADRLKRGERAIADSFAEATVLFADIVDFSRFSARRSPAELVRVLNEIFLAFDNLAEKHCLEKIKTIGDTYFAVAGVPTPRPDHAIAIAEMALDMQRAISCFRKQDGEPLAMRIGINSGPVVAGVIGAKKISYDLWGNTVNVASRMESHGVAGCIHVSENSYHYLQQRYAFEPRGAIPIKGMGQMNTYFLIGK
jgi:adenylate cyclase